MRIVDVNEFYSPTGGGVRTYVDRKMEILGDKGHQLIVIAPGVGDSVEVRPSGGQIIYVASPRMPFDANYGVFWKAKPIQDLLDQLSPDVIECSSPFRPAWIVGQWQGPALKIFFMHNDNVEAYPKRWFEGLLSPACVEKAFAWYSRYMGNFLSLYDAVVTNGPVLHQRLSQRGVRVDASMPLGIERQYFSPHNRDEALRAALLANCGLSPDASLLLGVGRHHREKRWELIVEAVRQAQSTRPIALYLVGTGPRRQAIERQIAGLPFIKLLDPIYDRDRLATLLASSDAYIHGSEAEPFGLVVSEALASGTPLIVPREGGAGAIARPAYSETFQGANASSCAQAIARLLDRDKRGLRLAATKAAAGVRSDTDHLEQLIAYYSDLKDRLPCTTIDKRSRLIEMNALTDAWT
jgi:alpha-1,6-mannosyltransferase